MFTAIAGSYDLNNRLHSLWQDVRWRNFAVRQAQVNTGETVLDVACGTGDLTQAFARTAAAKVTGLDFTPVMLDHARIKQQALRPEVSAKVTYIEGDAMALPLPDASVDVVSIAFGIRNVSDSMRARELRVSCAPEGVLSFWSLNDPGIRSCVGSTTSTAGRSCLGRRRSFLAISPVLTSTCQRVWRRMCRGSRCSRTSQKSV